MDVHLVLFPKTEKRQSRSMWSYLGSEDNLFGHDRYSLPLLTSSCAWDSSKIADDDYSLNMNEAGQAIRDRYVRVSP